MESVKRFLIVNALIKFNDIWERKLFPLLIVRGWKYRRGGENIVTIFSPRGEDIVGVKISSHTGPPAGRVLAENWFFLTHWGRVMHMCITQLAIIGSDNDQASSHYLNQCWNIVNWTLRNNLNWNLYIFIQVNAFGNVAWKMAAILFRPQCVNQIYPECYLITFHQLWRVSNCFCGYQWFYITFLDLMLTMSLKLTTRFRKISQYFDNLGKYRSTSITLQNISAILVLKVPATFLLSWEKIYGRPTGSPNLTSQLIELSAGCKGKVWLANRLINMES